MKITPKRIINAFLMRGPYKSFMWVYVRVKSKIKRKLFFMLSDIRFFSAKIKQQLLVKIIKKKYFRFDSSQWRDIKDYDRAVSIICKSFYRKYYIAVANLSADIGQTEALIHLFKIGLNKGLSPTPFYDQEFVTHQLSGSSFKASSFLQWLQISAQVKLVPHIIFDEVYYLDCYSDCISGNNRDAYTHYITEGVHRNYSPSVFFEPDWFMKTYKLESVKDPLIYYYFENGHAQYLRPSKLFPMRKKESSLTQFVSLLEVLLKCANGLSDEFGMEVERAKKGVIDDQLDSIFHSNSSLTLAVCRNPFLFLKNELEEWGNNKSFDSVVLIPRCGIGGSNVVAGELCGALKKIKKDDKILLIATDDDLFLRPDWFEDADEVYQFCEIALHFRSENQLKQLLLIELIKASKARNIFNINSLLAWDMYVNYGDRLKESHRLYGYAFCYHLNLLSEKGGYPITHVPHCIEALTNLFVDSNYLREDLIDSNEWVRNRDKVITLKTPYREKQVGDYYRWSQPEHKTGDKKIVFWAGRFDRQKRFDLVIEIAKSKPEYLFWVWGKAMLDEDLDESDLPKNIVLHGLFQNFDDLPLNKCDVWLYTAEWDGIPTTLIELGLRGVPVVASKVWGTADVITSKTSWPVSEVLDCKSYEVGLDHLIENPSTALKMGEIMRQLVLSEHNPNKYQSDLSDYII